MNLKIKGKLKMTTGFSGILTQAREAGDGPIVNQVRDV